MFLPFFSTCRAILEGAAGFAEAFVAAADECAAVATEG